MKAAMLGALTIQQGLNEIVVAGGMEVSDAGWIWCEPPVGSYLKSMRLLLSVAAFLGHH
jgi:acetyl-CoA acetyltransferase